MRSEERADRGSTVSPPRCSTLPDTGCRLQRGCRDFRGSAFDSPTWSSYGQACDDVVADNDSCSDGAEIRKGIAVIEGEAGPSCLHDFSAQLLALVGLYMLRNVLVELLPIELGEVELLDRRRVITRGGRNRGGEYRTG